MERLRLLWADICLGHGMWRPFFFCFFFFNLANKFVTSKTFAHHRQGEFTHITAAETSTTGTCSSLEVVNEHKNTRILVLNPGKSKLAKKTLFVVCRSRACEISFPCAVEENKDCKKDYLSTGVSKSTNDIFSLWLRPPHSRHQQSHLIIRIQWNLAGLQFASFQQTRVLSRKDSATVDGQQNRPQQEFLFLFRQKVRGTCTTVTQKLNHLRALRTAWLRSWCSQASFCIHNGNASAKIRADETAEHMIGQWERGPQPSMQCGGGGNSVAQQPTIRDADVTQRQQHNEKSWQKSLLQRMKVIHR